MAARAGCRRPAGRGPHRRLRVGHDRRRAGVARRRGRPGRLRAGDEEIEVDGRANVFERSGWSAIVGPETQFALDGDLPEYQ